ncbi:hypothetical protein HBH70_030770 [Parastagonospora nodorum]|nr:hypothetical protein HBH52_120410 [Parastagonospora nodorum]KAH3984554.1 hypothetical protein HBH51_028370 [Parastagonospora nodorum]KAH4000421.1 hypothetical protein HBI10_101150 [Parastagonospora nodorum]KAH4026607.1 hypothetical protein HBI13_064450 [Parastagonospora nodorum]KAH4051919.1 hypothetical protein HBH49_109650 [Parastagonospora nodorum]
MATQPLSKQRHNQHQYTATLCTTTFSPSLRFPSLLHTTSSSVCSFSSFNCGICIQRSATRL